MIRAQWQVFLPENSLPEFCQALAQNTGCSCLPLSAASTAGISCSKSATAELGFCSGSSCLSGTKIYILCIHQPTDILRRGSQSIICGDAEHHRKPNAQARFCRHRDRGIRNSVCKLGKRVSRARGQSPERQSSSWVQEALLGNGMNHLSAADILRFPNKVCGTSKPRIRLVRIVRHDRGAADTRPRRYGASVQKPSQRCRTSRRGQNPTSNLISLTPPSYCKWYS